MQVLNMKVSKNVNLHKEVKPEAENQRKRKAINKKADKFSVINEEYKYKKKKVNHNSRKINNKEINSKNSSLNASVGNNSDVSCSRKKKKSKIDNVYKPGMITEILQMRKFGKVVLPWDPSFGLDPSYKPPRWDTTGPKPVVNPLFDLAKRNFTGKVVDAAGHSIFVGNLDYETKVGDLKKLFRRCGKIIKVKLRKSSHKSSRVKSATFTNAVIRFEKVEGCTAALKMNGKLYKERHLRVTYQENCSKTDSKRSIFVGNIAFEAGEEDLWKAFENCGDIESVRIVRDKQTEKSKGFGYVNFKSSDGVNKAVDLNETYILGHELRIMRSEDNMRSLSNTIMKKRKKKKRKKINLNSKRETDKEHKL